VVGRIFLLPSIPEGRRISIPIPLHHFQIDMYNEASKTFCDLFYVETPWTFFILTGMDQAINGASNRLAGKLFIGMPYWEAVSKAKGKGWIIEKL
jgi:hypothetical protein